MMLLISLRGWNEMVDFKKLEHPKSDDDKEILSRLESLALECSLLVSATTRHDYDMGVSRWINDFSGDLAFRRQMYLSHYLRKKYDYISGRSGL